MCVVYYEYFPLVGLKGKKDGDFFTGKEPEWTLTRKIAGKGSLYADIHPLGENSLEFVKEKRKFIFSPFLSLYALFNLEIEFT